MCVIKSLFIMAVLHVYLCVTENGGSVLRQHHRTTADRTGVLSDGLLRQEVSFLPQGKRKSRFYCPGTGVILLVCSDEHLYCAAARGDASSSL